MISSPNSSTPNDTQRCVFLVTGATGAIGKAIARQLAEIPNSKVVPVCRNRNKGQQTVEAIISATQSGYNKPSLQLTALIAKRLGMAT